MCQKSTCLYLDFKYKLMILVGNMTISAAERGNRIYNSSSSLWGYPGNRCFMTSQCSYVRSYVGMHVCMYIDIVYVYMSE